MTTIQLTPPQSSYSDRTFGAASATPGLGILLHGIVALLVFSGFFVLFEPAPYEILAIVVLVLFAALGVPVHRGLIPLFLLMMAYLAFGFPAALMAEDRADGLFYITVTSFLGITGFLFAIYVANNPLDNSERIKKAYIAACVIVSFFGICGYLGLLPGGELFTRFGRAKGTFEDPNVFGAFVVIGCLFCFHAILTKSLVKAAVYLPILLFITLGVFFSFSRGAWLMLVLCGGLLTVIMFLTSTDAAQKFKITVLFAIAAAGGVVLIVLALSIDQVSDLFAERAQLIQTYDAGHEGRFARHIRGLAMLIEHPLGIGQGEFGKIFTEDPHNVYLKAFAVHGWGGAAAYLALILITLYKGTLLAFTPSPLQRAFLPFFAGFIGLTLLAMIIDIDRWRFHYLVLGSVWGFIAVAEGNARKTMAMATKRISLQTPSR